MNITQKKRFWSRVATGTPDECWEWQGSTFPNGYGRIGMGGRHRLAHRAAWELTFGAIPAGLCCLHRCDNKSCVNPDHLFLGTKADNSADMIAKGRSKQGSRNPKSKLSDSDVQEIRILLESGVMQTEIASIYQVSNITVNHISTGRTWGWLKGE